MLSLMLFKMRLTMFEYLTIFKYALMSKWQSENLLETSFKPYFAAQTAVQIVEFLLDNTPLLNKQL